MTSLNQRILQTQRELLVLLRGADNQHKVGRAISIDKELQKTIDAQTKRRAHLIANDKRNKVKPGQGIRPAILDVLRKSRKDLKRSELAILVSQRAPRGVSWSLGSCNMALAGLMKDRMLKKDSAHGGKFSITPEGREYARTVMKRAAA